MTAQRHRRHGWRLRYATGHLTVFDLAVFAVPGGFAYFAGRHCADTRNWLGLSVLGVLWILILWGEVSWIWARYRRTVSPYGRSRRGRQGR